MPTNGMVLLEVSQDFPKHVLNLNGFEVVTWYLAVGEGCHVQIHVIEAVGRLWAIMHQD